MTEKEKNHADTNTFQSSTTSGMRGQLDLEV